MMKFSSLRKTCTGFPVFADPVKINVKLRFPRQRQICQDLSNNTAELVSMSRARRAHNDLMEEHTDLECSKHIESIWYWQTPV